MGANFSDGSGNGHQRTPSFHSKIANGAVHSALTVVDSPTSVENVHSQQHYEQRQQQAPIREVFQQKDETHDTPIRQENHDFYPLAFDLEDDTDDCEGSTIRMIAALCDKAQKVVVEMSALIPPMPPAGGNLRAQVVGRPPRPPSPAPHTAPGKSLRVASGEHPTMDATQYDDGQEELPARVQACDAVCGNALIDGAAISDGSGSQAAGVAGVDATPRAAFEERLTQAAHYLAEGSSQVAGVLLESKDIVRTLEAENIELRSENGELRIENRVLRARLGAEATAGHGSTIGSVAGSARASVASEGQHQERLLSHPSHASPAVQSKVLTSGPSQRATATVVTCQVVDTGGTFSDAAVTDLVSTATPPPPFRVHLPSSITSTRESTPVQTARPLSAAASSSSLTHRRQHVVTTSFGKENASPMRQASFQPAPCTSSSTPVSALVTGTPSYRSPVIVEAQVPKVRISGHVVHSARAVG